MRRMALQRQTCVSCPVLQLFIKSLSLKRRRLCPVPAYRPQILWHNPKEQKVQRWHTMCSFNNQ
jgi:hypothetical protein